MLESTHDEEQMNGSDMTVSTGFVVTHLDDPQLRILDIRTADAYAEAHIPGAFLLELSTITCQIDQVPGMLLPAQEFAAVMQRRGVNSDSTVILYDDNWGMPSARVLWALQRYGHSGGAILAGGWDQWQAEDLPVSSVAPSIQPGNFTSDPQDGPIAQHDWLVQHLAHDDVALIDTRTPGEFEQGHLPGAINWDWMNGVPSQGWEPFKSKREVVEQMTSLGITPDQEVITYCRSGARAAHTYVLLRRAGFRRVRNYDGSWLEWSLRHA